MLQGRSGTGKSGDIGKARIALQSETSQQDPKHGQHLRSWARRVEQVLVCILSIGGERALPYRTDCTRKLRSKKKGKENEKSHRLPDMSPITFGREATVSLLLGIGLNGSRSGGSCSSIRILQVFQLAAQQLMHH